MILRSERLEKGEEALSGVEVADFGDGNLKVGPIVFDRETLSSVPGDLDVGRGLETGFGLDGGRAFPMDAGIVLFADEVAIFVEGRDVAMDIDGASGSGKTAKVNGTIGIGGVGALVLALVLVFDLLLFVVGRFEVFVILLALVVVRRILGGRRGAEDGAPG